MSENVNEFKKSFKNMVIGFSVGFIILFIVAIFNEPPTQKTIAEPQTQKTPSKMDKLKPFCKRECDIADFTEDMKSACVDECIYKKLSDSNSKDPIHFWDY
jgi:hypothetical protein